VPASSAARKKENESGRSRSAKRLLSRVELRNHLARRWLADGPLEGAHNARGQGSNGEARESLNSAPEKRCSARPDEGLRALGKESESRDRYPTHPTRWSRTVVQGGAVGKKKMNCNSTLGQKSEFLMGASAEQRSAVQPRPGGRKSWFSMAFHSLATGFPPPAASCRLHPKPRDGNHGKR